MPTPHTTPNIPSHTHDEALRGVELSLDHRAEISRGLSDKALFAVHFNESGEERDGAVVIVATE